MCIQVSRRTVLLGRVSSSTRQTLASMPALKVECEPGGATTSSSVGRSQRDQAEAGSVYILPPIWYDEFGGGGWYIKIGGGANDFIKGPAEELDAAIESWRVAEPHPQQLAFLKQMVAKVLPGVMFEEWQTKNCITTTAGDEPLFRELRANGRVLVVANVQGKGVMPSYAIGDEVASTALRALGGVGSAPGRTVGAESIKISGYDPKLPALGQILANRKALLSMHKSGGVAARDIADYKKFLSELARKLNTIQPEIERKTMLLKARAKRTDNDHAVRRQQAVIEEWDQEKHLFQKELAWLVSLPAYQQTQAIVKDKFRVDGYGEFYDVDEVCGSLAILPNYCYYDLVLVFQPWSVPGIYSARHADLPMSANKRHE